MKDRQRDIYMSTDDHFVDLLSATRSANKGKNAYDGKRNLLQDIFSLKIAI